MPQYHQPISSHGFQQLSFSSETENYGIGSMAVDIGINMALESAASALLGHKGFLGGRPLMGMFPMMMPSGFDPANPNGVIDNFMNTRISPLAATGRRASTNNMPRGPRGYRAWNIGDKVFGGSSPVNRIRRAFHSPEKQILSSYAASGISKAAGAPGLATAGRLAIGLGLRSVARAWMFNDMFAGGFSMALGSIQGLNTFNYERRNREEHSEMDLGEGFADTRGSYTQRQTAMAAIHNSQMNTRAAMGNEATFMHG